MQLVEIRVHISDKNEYVPNSMAPEQTGSMMSPHKKMQSIDESMPATKPHQLGAILSLLLAATLWGVFWYPLRLLEQHGLHGLWSTFLLYSGTLPTMLLLMRGRWGEFSRAPWMLLAIALASGWCNTTFILAILEGNVVRVLLLFYLSPLWATLMGWLLLREQLQRDSLFVLGLALAGAVIMLWQPEAGVPWPQERSDWLALSSGFSFALVNVLVRSTQAVSVYSKTASAWLGVIAVAAILILLTGRPVGEASVSTIISALMIGAVVLVVMTLSVVYGVTHLPVHRSAVILLFEIVAGAVSAQLLTDEVVLLQEWVGGGFVILAAYLAAHAHIKA
jgi:drug/metabolite transporter (DMT)-like permease